MQARRDEEGGAADARGPAAGLHPVASHPRHDPQRRIRHHLRSAQRNNDHSHARCDDSSDAHIRDRAGNNDRNSYVSGGEICSRRQNEKKGVYHTCVFSSNSSLEAKRGM